jgi:antitoxin HigA-1
MKIPIIYHPGEILSTEFLKPANLSPEQLANDISVSPSLIHELINEETDLNKDLSIRLALYFNTALTF